MTHFSKIGPTRQTGHMAPARPAFRTKSKRHSWQAPCKQGVRSSWAMASVSRGTRSLRGARLKRASTVDDDRQHPPRGAWPGNLPKQRGHSLASPTAPTLSPVRSCNSRTTCVAYVMLGPIGVPTNLATNCASHAVPPACRAAAIPPVSAARTGLSSNLRCDRAPARGRPALYQLPPCPGLARGSGTGGRSTGASA